MLGFRSTQSGIPTMQNMTQKKKFGRRSVVTFWLALIALVIALLIGFEQIAVLYVLATLALVALLLIVSFSNLEGVGLDTGE